MQANLLRGVALFFLLLATGCVRVRPWERSRLAHHSMTTEQTGPAVGHVYAVQEGAVGGEGASSSGCGCN